MNNIIICEGSTDYILLQYYLRKACSWDDDIDQNLKFKYKSEPSRRLMKGDSKLTIASSGGVSNIANAFELIIDKNMLASPINVSEKYDKILIFTDHDDKKTESEWSSKIEAICADKGLKKSQNGDGVYSYIDKTGNVNIIEIILLVIPFDECGALETFLLDAIKTDNDYDRQIVESCENFVDNVDTNKKYLNHRRLIVKAKFDVYFSIRTPLKQFRERQDILKSIPWEQYALVNESFKILDRLG